MTTSQIVRMRSFRTGVVGGLISLLVGASGEPALAHSFSLAIVANGSAGPTELRAAVQGALTASAEKDGHPDETADGHLGGLDVFLIPLPEAAAEQIDGLVDHKTESFDFIVPLGAVPVDMSGLQGVTSQTIVLNLGDLPDPAAWSESSTSNTKSFAARYRRRFGEQPDAFSAHGYYAARKIDHAVRESSGLSSPEETRKILDANGQRIDW